MNRNRVSVEKASAANIGQVAKLTGSAELYSCYFN